MNWKCVGLSGTASLMALLMPTLSAASDDQWHSGYGMGVCEASVSSGAGNEIYVACECGSGTPSTIHFTIGGETPSSKHLFLTFDAKDAQYVSLWDGVIPSDCRACDDNFRYALEGFKGHSKVRVMLPSGEATTFTLKNATEALGSCVSSFGQ